MKEEEDLRQREGKVVRERMRVKEEMLDEDNQRRKRVKGRSRGRRKGSESSEGGKKVGGRGDKKMWDKNVVREREMVRRRRQKWQQW